ncbi:50S ribosomal protein L15e [Candidatus Woesearchaeota archaeon]|nr:50S ribosomal protein L15e [Candidatus Woesearchaeota archaeon]
MGYLKYVRDLWKRPKKELGSVWKERLIAWRQEPVSVRISRPTRIDRARSLGYKAKQGFLIVRQRLLRGGRQRPDIKSGRRPKHFGQRLTLKKNYQQVAEERVSKLYKNCTVVNSYLVAKDGLYYWYEIILVDRNHPNVVKDKQLSNLAKKKGRAQRGLSSAGRKGRGLLCKGKGAEKIRPSLRSNKRLR